MSSQSIAKLHVYTLASQAQQRFDNPKEKNDQQCCGGCATCVCMA
jgi:hypothetical protein